MSVKEKIAALRGEIGGIEGKLDDLYNKLIEEESNALFEKYPWLTSYGWCQYTPYFNDGEPCSFSVNCYDPYINGDWSWNFEGSDINVSQESLEACCKEIKTFVESFSENFLLRKFGDHSMIVVEKDGGVRRESYDHE